MTNAGIGDYWVHIFNLFSECSRCPVQFVRQAIVFLGLALLQFFGL